MLSALYSEVPVVRFGVISPKGTGTPLPSPSAKAISLANATHGPAPTAGLARKVASEVLSPEERKKFSKGGATKGPVGPTPHGFTPVAVATVSGFDVGFAVPGAAVPAFTAFTAFRQLAIRSCGLTGFTLIGRLRWRPPVELYAMFNERSWPRSCSMPNEICCT